MRQKTRDDGRAAGPRGWRRSLLLLLVLTLGFGSAAQAFPCIDCDRILDRCWRASAAQFNACNLDCYIPPPVGPLGILACLAGCEVAWIARNTVCLTDWATCEAQNQFCDDPENPICPVIVDLDRNDLHLSGPDDPVLFDLDADGDMELVTWTRGDQQDGFLCLDRNRNGVIDDGSELFGNNTPLELAGGVASNGYIPISELDALSLGGNLDGFIDTEDAIFADLCVWTDSNHNGISERHEISSLAAAGVERIGLAHAYSRRTDQHGNELRYKGDAWIKVKGKTKHTKTFDAFLVEAEN